MKSRSLLALLVWPMAFMPAGCGVGHSGDGDAGTTSGRDGRDEPKWQIDYSGDLSGQIQGKSLVIVRTGLPAHLNFAVKSIGKNPGLTATLSFREGTASGFLTRMTLEDGTRCTPFNRSDVNIHDTSKENFHATVNGQMKCGEAEDQVIDFEAVIQER